MQPWELIEERLNQIQKQIEAIREDVNSWKPKQWESYYESGAGSDKEKQRLYNLREQRYYDMRAQLDADYNRMTDK
jgi:tagatose-1,6-bisphosphate aldolase non-catalytic subunit AgaZ/GatZ